MRKASEISVWECPGGPLLVRGAGAIIDDGETHDVERPVVAICRCGGSGILPFCDSTHKVLRRRKAS